jgi:PAS domain S-box-containing protein
MTAFDDPDIESLFAGSAETGFQPARMLIAAIDPTLRVTCSSCSFGRGPPRTYIRPGATLETLFRREPLRSRVQAEVPAVIAGDLRTLEFERTGPKGDERIRLHLAPRFHAPESPRGMFILAYDLTERERAAASAEATKERLGAILDHAADAIVVVDESGVVEEINLAAAHLFGWNQAEIAGKPLSVLMDQPYASLHQRYVESYLSTGKSAILNVGPRPLPARRKDGAPLAIELSVGEACIGGARRFIGAARDITERLRQEEELRRVNQTLAEKVTELERLSAELEEQRRRSEALAQAADIARQAAEHANLAKSRMLATVSHELRTPLNGVLAVADLLAKRPLAEPEQELAAIIRRSGRDLVNLVSDVLDLSKIEAGAMEVIAEPFSLGEVLSSLAEVWRVAAEAKGLRLTLSAGPLPDFLVGDGSRLRQVLANIISNAIKYTQEGGVVVTAIAAPSETGSFGVTITIADTGPGIDEHLAAHLFEPFARGKSEHTRRETGTGLGLAISYELVRLMGGEIRVVNAAPHGAQVVITLELPLADPPLRDDPEPAILLPLPSRPARVLVAEDHPINRVIMGLMLEELHCDYATASDGEEAVEAAAREAFDLILMDVRMPRMDGLEAARAIRSSEGPSAAAPIIAVTADAMPSDDPEIADAGVSGILTKPLALADLARAIEAALALTEPTSQAGVDDNRVHHLSGE